MATSPAGSASGRLLYWRCNRFRGRAAVLGLPIFSPCSSPGLAKPNDKAHSTPLETLVGSASLQVSAFFLVAVLMAVLAWRVRRHTTATLLDFCRCPGSQSHTLVDFSLQIPVVFTASALLGPG